jgi:AraC family transcriptional regulator
MNYVCTIRRLNARPAATVQREVPFADASAAMIDGFSAIGQYLRQAGMKPAGETFTRFLRIGPDGLKLEVGFTVLEPLAPAGPVQASQLPGGEAAVTLHRGPYERLPEALAALQQWVREQGRRAAGPFWEVYLNGPPDVTDPELFETEVVIPLEP